MSWLSKSASSNSYYIIIPKKGIRHPTIELIYKDKQYKPHKG